nr:hypothetical protein [Pseudomonadota bacterium]
MDRADRRHLNVLADEMLDEARAVGRTNIYSATGYSRQNISIVHQQVRCANLAWALRWRHKLRKGDVVAIVGGSFSGMMLACSIAIADDVIVYVIEKEKRLLHRFLDKSQRYLSPNLNSRDLRKSFSPDFASPIYRPAIFNWEAGSASDVASAWLQEFALHADKLPIFTIFGTEVTPDAVSEVDGKVNIQLGSSGSDIRPLSVDVLIDATGFGSEAQTLPVTDHSYWEGGHRLIYDHLPPKCRVLVSGCGDSGIIEVMHYAFADFKHDMVENFWPTGSYLEDHLDRGLEKINDVLRSAEVERYDFKVISELCWWLDHWWFLQNWSQDDLKTYQSSRSTKTIFSAIERQMGDQLSAAFPGKNADDISWEEREDLLLTLPLSKQLEVRRAVASVIDDAISCDIANHMKQVHLAKLLNTRKLRTMLRPGVEIVLNGLTPTPFTRNLSAYNVWLTKVVMSLPNVRYLRGRISNMECASDGKSTVNFENGKSEVFDRVVTRYGPSGDDAAQPRLTEGALRDPYPGDFLLANPHYFLPGRNLSDQTSTVQRVEPPYDRVKKRVQTIKRRRGSNPADPLIKSLYLSILFAGKPYPFVTDPRYTEPQRKLSEALKAGRCPAYSDWHSMDS